MSMQELVAPAHSKVAFRRFALPDAVPADRLRVRHTHGAEKHGTMISFYRGHGNTRGAWDSQRQMHTPGQGVGWDYPIPLGNMQVGYVEAVGKDVEGFAEGDRVVHFNNFRPVADAVPSITWKIKETTSWKAATCLDPASFAFCALRDGQVRIGDTIAVFSLGAIGLMAVALAKQSGCSRIVAVDMLENRRAAATALGATDVLNPADHDDLGLHLRELTQYAGVDVAIEYSGSVHAMQAAIKGVSFGGTIVAGAFPAPYPAGLDFGGEAHMNRPNIVFTRTESDPNRDHPRWNNVRVRDVLMDMINAGQIDAEPVITPIVPFTPDDAFVEQYRQIATEPQNNIKFGVEYPSV
jgi:threonine dehydrogenase-like Zn-dependent dehydrogenase